ncbi:MAG: CinA family nicotinamide mononucleotide deamidase-related protein [Chloroflexia bacterium]
MKAEIVSIGTELLLGTINDTNAQYLAQRLAGLGIDCYYVSQVGDNLGRIIEVLARAWERSELTITTGGLGPTGDDLTREAIAAMLGEAPVVVPALEESLRSFFARRGARMPEQNLKQATVIPSASAIPNPLGTAPGWWVRRDAPQGMRAVVSMPGVPFEMKRMWEREVEPQLARITGTLIVSRTLKTLGLGESTAEEMVADLMQGSNPTLAPYAKADGVHLRITAKAADRDTAQAMIAGLESKVRERLGTAIYGADDDTPAGVISALLEAADLNVAVLEIGHGGVGSVAPLLSSSGRMLSPLAKPGHATNNRGIDIESAARSLLDEMGARLALVVQVTQESVGDEGRTVRFDAEICLAARQHDGTDRAWRIRQSWQTAQSEVTRLVGLAALNLLRRHLVERLEAAD